MASTSWLLRILPVPLMPRPLATFCKSGSSMADSPVPRRLAPVWSVEVVTLVGATVVSVT